MVNGSRCLTDTTTITANVSNGASPYTYQWTGPSFNGTVASFAVTAAGPYQVTVTDQNLCVASSSVQIFDPYLPSQSLASKTAICEGESIQLSVNTSSATAYHWSSNTGGATSATLSLYPPVPSALYVVTVTSLNGCTATAASNITVNARPAGVHQRAISDLFRSDYQLTSFNRGIWVSSNSAVATVNSSGIVQELPWKCQFCIHQCEHKIVLLCLHQESL